MKILYIAQFFNRPDEAGAGRHYAFAVEWARMGHDVTVITGQQNYRTGLAARAGVRPIVESCDGVTVKRCYTYTGYRGNLKKRYLNFASFTVSSVLAGLREETPDVVFASSPPLTVAIAGDLVARAKRAPLVLDIRDLWPESVAALGVVRARRFLHSAERVARHLYARADRLIGVTDGIVDGLVAAGVPRAKIAKITNGVDVGLYDSPPARDSMRETLGLADRFLCVYVGGMGILHDVGTLVGAAAHLRGTPVHFLLVGQGDDRPRLERIVREEGLTNVTFHDPVPKARVPGLIASADCAVYSLKNEPFFRGTFPNKNFDYLAAGTPVVLAVEGESAELVRDAGAGIVTPPEDPAGLAAGIRALAATAVDERRRMAERGRSYVLRNYRREDLARKLERVLRDVCGATSRPAQNSYDKRGVA
jgi:glycosyltransferase involved in cell wall biosynthesis